jgi:hypothetical protein
VKWFKGMSSAFLIERHIITAKYDFWGEYARGFAFSHAAYGQLCDFFLGKNAEKGIF